MSLTSYRAAPPRVGSAVQPAVMGWAGWGGSCGLSGLWCAGLPGLAATSSSAPCGAVPLALGVFTAEFGMGSGVLPPAVATRPGKPAGCGGGDGVTGSRSVLSFSGLFGCRRAGGRVWPLHAGGVVGDWRFRAISTGRLHGLPRFHLRPIDVVVFHGSRRDLVLRGASRLDAFSGYPVRT
jgi:hypothetical protein